MATVTLERVNKVYPSRHGPVHAVQDLDMEVEDGGFVTLLGPSGCGKTSTLRMIVGLEAITSGTIAFDGRQVNALGPEERNVAMAFETYALYPTFTVAENLAFPLEVRGIPESERRAQVAEIARLLRIEDILDSHPLQLSGGQQQRVSLGRALIRAPAAFILDEVMSHLDAHLKFQMLFELKRIHQSIGRTTVYVTHDQMEALALADRVAVMSNARLQQYADRDTLYDRPANMFVAGFIGEPPTNFIHAQVHDRRAGLRLLIEGTEIEVEPDGARASAIRNAGLGRVVIGLRPQNLGIEASEQLRPIPATVLLNEYLGEQAILTARVGEAELRAIVPPEADARPDQPTTLYYRPHNVMVFDPETEAFVG